MDKKFWKDKRVLVTGHTGFKGSWLSLWLVNCGAEVHGYALAPETNPNLFNVLNLKAKLASSTIADIRDLPKLKETFLKIKPEIVLHLAAQPLVLRGYVDPVETYSTNVMGTVNILECTRLTDSVKSVVNVTTDKCYENNEWIWPYRENDRLGGFDPYSNSKACSELVTSSYRNSFFKNSSHALIASARAGNVIGGGDWAENRLIPDIVKAMIQNEALTIRNPQAIRPWQHVLEPVRGYLELAEKLYLRLPGFDDGWNFGPQEEDSRSVEWIVKYLAAKFSDFKGYEIKPNPAQHEANLLRLDITKAAIKLNWRPSLSLAQTLDHIAEWYLAYKNGSDMNSLTTEFISKYESLNGIS